MLSLGVWVMANIKDVAARAGVSSSTVSRVLADKPHISAKVRKKVLQAAEELDYRPVQIAKRLRTQGPSRLIGLLISGVLNTHFNAIIHGVSDLAYTHELHLLFCNAVGDTTREHYYFDLMRAERAAGLIVNPQDRQRDGRYLNELRKSGTAVVLLDSSVADYSFDFVTADNRQGAYLAVQHLIEQGHRRIGTIIGKRTVTTAVERLRGYTDALNEAGITVDERLIRDGGYEEEGAYAATRAILSGDAPTALFVANEPMTVGALRAIREHGLRIPDDIAIVGYDETPWSAQVNPPLTTVAQPTYALGREAVRLLMRRINEPDAPSVTVTLPTELIIRESSGTVGIVTPPAESMSEIGS